jgi:hypothetical protein
MEIKELMCECKINATTHPKCPNFPITSFHYYLVILFSVNVKNLITFQVVEDTSFFDKDCRKR